MLNLILNGIQLTFTVSLFILISSKLKEHEAADTSEIRTPMFISVLFLIASEALLIITKVNLTPQFTGFQIFCGFWLIFLSMENFPEFNISSALEDEDALSPTTRLIITLISIMTLVFFELIFFMGGFSAISFRMLPVFISGLFFIFGKAKLTSPQYRSQAKPSRVHRIREIAIGLFNVIVFIAFFIGI